MARELYTQATNPNSSPAYGGQPHLMNVQPQFPQAPPNQGVPPGYFPPAQQQQQQNFVQQQNSGTYPQQSQPNTGSTPPNLYSSAPIPAQNQNQYSPPGGPGNVGSYEYNPYQQAANAHSDPRFVNNPSPPLYNQPADRKLDGSPQPQLPQPQSPSAAYNQQQQQQQQFQPQYQQERGFNPQSQPQPYPVMQTSQPVAVPGMDVRNVKNLPRNANGEREWSHGLCDCFGDCGTCFLSWCCPCIVYSQVKSRLDHLQRNGYPHPSGGESTGSDCCIHGLLSCCGFGWVLQIGSRGNIRDRYRVEGGGCGDCMSAWCCTPCELTQESRELELEEKALLQAGGKH